MDPISDMLTQIRNAVSAKKAEVVLPYSKFKENLGQLLVQEGWLLQAQAVDTLEVKGKKKPFRALKLGLKYNPDGTPGIAGLKRISRLGQRIYAKVSEIPRFRLGIGATIISTSQGLMTDQKARKAKLGGEVICQIW